MVTDHSKMQQWYVIYTNRHKEELAQFYLKWKGIETFFPRLFLSLAEAPRRIVPLFPNYLFARLYLPVEYAFARWSPGVKYVVGFNNEPAPIEDEIVEFLQRKANPEGILVAHPKLRCRQEIRINSGPLAGLLGIIENPPDARGRVKVLMHLLNRQVKVEVPVQNVEHGWTVAGADEVSK